MHVCACLQKEGMGVFECSEVHLPNKYIYLSCKVNLSLTLSIILCKTTLLQNCHIFCYCNISGSLNFPYMEPVSFLTVVHSYLYFDVFTRCLHEHFSN